MHLEVLPHPEVDIPDDPLMNTGGRRRHVVLPVDQFVPAPIVWEQQEVVVGELHARSRRLLHLFAPRHALIVAPVMTTEMPCGFTMKFAEHASARSKVRRTSRTGDR